MKVWGVRYSYQWTDFINLSRVLVYLLLLVLLVLVSSPLPGFLSHPAGTTEITFNADTTK